MSVHSGGVRSDVERSAGHPPGGGGVAGVALGPELDGVRPRSCRSPSRLRAALGGGAAPGAGLAVGLRAGASLSTLAISPIVRRAVVRVGSVRLAPRQQEVARVEVRLRQGGSAPPGPVFSICRHGDPPGARKGACAASRAARKATTPCRPRVPSPRQASTSSRARNRRTRGALQRSLDGCRPGWGREEALTRARPRPPGRCGRGLRDAAGLGHRSRLPTSPCWRDRWHGSHRSPSGSPSPGGGRLPAIAGRRRLALMALLAVAALAAVAAGAQRLAVVAAGLALSPDHPIAFQPPAATAAPRRRRIAPVATGSVAAAVAGAGNHDLAALASCRSPSGSPVSVSPLPLNLVAIGSLSSAARVLLGGLAAPGWQPRSAGVISAGPRLGDALASRVAFAFRLRSGRLPSRPAPALLCRGAVPGLPWRARAAPRAPSGRVVF